MNDKRIIEILDVGIHDVTMGEVKELVRSMVLSKQQHHISPVNPEMIITSMENKAFRSILSKASLSLPDGIGILIAGWLLRNPFRERVTGADTVKTIAKVAQQDGFTMFLLGAAPGVAKQASQILQKENIGLKIVGTYAGSPDSLYDDEICSIIEKANPDILLVAYGSPKQDFWIIRTMPRLHVPVTMSVGGTFDFIAGVQRRAPVWMQRTGLEWFFRLIQEPHRWRRMLALPKFIIAVLLRKYGLG